MQREAGSRQALTRGHVILFSAAAAVICIADLITKQWAFEAIQFGHSVRIIDGVFYLTTSCNTGGVFGWLRGHVFALTVVSLFAVGFILWVFWRQGGESLRLTLGLGLLLGGAIGNLYDRISLQKVRDFLDFRIAGWRYPTFNIADVAICMGVGLLLLVSFFAKEPEGDQTEADAPRKKGQPTR